MHLCVQEIPVVVGKPSGKVSKVAASLVTGSQVGAAGLPKVGSISGQLCLFMCLLVPFFHARIPSNRGEVTQTPHVQKMPVQMRQQTFHHT